MSNFFKPVSFVTLVSAVSGRLSLQKFTRRCLLLVVTVSYISFLFIFIVSVVSREDVQFFFTCFIRYTCFSSFRQIVSIKNLFRCLLLIVTVRFISFPLSFIVSVVSVEDVHFFKPVSFVTLVTAVSGRLCLLKILLRCLLLIVTVRFISFPLSFIVSDVSVVDAQFF